MKIKFLVDYEGGQTGGELVKAGAITEMGDAEARSLINTGKAVEVNEPAPKSKKVEE